MKYLKIFIALFIFSVFVVVSCVQEEKGLSENQMPKDELIILRSQLQNNSSVEVDCGPADYDPEFVCNPYPSIPKTFETSHGCEVTVFMEVEKCEAENGDFYFVFSDLDWDFNYPLSSECKDWLLSTYQAGTANEEYDEFLDEIVTTYQKLFMEDYVIYHNVTDGVVGSTKYFKVLCTQRCIAPPVGPDGYSDGNAFGIKDIPCATSGCCVTVIFYYIDDDKIKTEKVTELIEACGPHFPVDCSPYLPYGECRDTGCL